MAAWQQISGVELLPWEAKTLRRLSNDYADQAHKSRKADCFAPFLPDEDEETIDDRVSRGFARMFGKSGTRKEA